jgi:hypothetical protein
MGCGDRAWRRMCAKRGHNEMNQGKRIQMGLAAMGLAAVGLVATGLSRAAIAKNAVGIGRLARRSRR